jgi:azurin
MRKRSVGLNNALVGCLAAVLQLVATVTFADDNQPVRFKLRALSPLQFDQVRLAVQPGTLVSIELENADDMDHNLVITRPGAREKVVNAALNLGEKGPEMNYVPRSGDILYSLPVVPPHQTKTLTFKAPEQPGVYPYVCTYPGHGFVMYGALYVTRDALPPLESDNAIPESRRVTSSPKEHHDSHNAPSPHPYPLEAPYLYRIFMPDSGPAAIAVCLPDSIAYCWDAGACRLRYAWKGEFIDASIPWKIKGDALAKIAGTVFYTIDNFFPIRISTSSEEPKIDFLGYQLIKGYPEFHYTVNGVAIFELIKENEKGGITQTFRIPKASRPLTILLPADGRVRYETSKGKVENGKLILSPNEARSFSISISPVTNQPNARN